MSDIIVVLKKIYFESPLRYNVVGCFVNEIVKLESKMDFYIKRFKKILL